jgi:ABC-type spermidine/putrescine transport system permease subunit II
VSAVVLARGRSVVRQRRRFADAAVDGGLGGFAVVLYAFLYLPIAVVVLYAFNDSRQVAVWNGFATRWWGIAWQDAAVVDALVLSTWTAATNAVLATVLGTAAALGLRNAGSRVRIAFDALAFSALIVPEIVIAIASLLFFATTVPSLLGPTAIILTHAVFNTSVVTLICRARLANTDRVAEEAAMDLCAARWETFRRVTLPLLLPAVAAGFLLSFTFSFDDVVLSTFVTTAGSSTLPLAIFSELRFGLSPKANVIATSMLAVTLVAVITAQVLLRRSRPGDER